MKIDNFKQFIETLAPITDREWQDLRNLFTIETVKKNDYFCISGEVCNKIGFVVSGVMRSFFEVSGKEITTSFQFPNSMAVSMYSFLENQKSQESIQAIRDTQLITINRETLYDLYSKSWKWQQIGRVLIEKNYTLMEQRLLILQSKNATEKYQALINSDKNIIRHIPLQYISSYLGITPETLSRIRKKSFKI